MHKDSCKEEVFNDLFRSNSRDLVAYIYHKFGPDSNANDMMQDAFVALWKNCSKVLPEKARSYLFTVAQNMTLKQIRKSRTSDEYVLSLDNNLAHENPEYQLEEKEFAAQFEAAMNTLSDKQRIAFMLFKVEGKKHKEIAEMLGISQKAVEKRIYTAAELLLKTLGKKI